jgi:hypothetical protein
VIHASMHYETKVAGCNYDADQRYSDAVPGALPHRYVGQYDVASGLRNT